jgi:hypothetical protein
MGARVPAEPIPKGVGLECWEFGDMGSGTPDEEKAIALMRAAHGLGVVSPFSKDWGP